MFEFQMAASHPFPTLWSAKDGTSSLVQLLPSKEDIFLLIEGFQCRAQSCSFPHLPEECTRREIERFLENVETNAQVHPDMLALLFSTLALGVHNAAYDRYGGKWVAGAMEDETKKGDVYGKPNDVARLEVRADKSSRCCHASLEIGFLYEPTNLTGCRNSCDDRSIPHQQRQIS